MPSNPLRAARRRLATILGDENYGPKLARLNKADERAVLDLIEQNRGREARQQIDTRDETRRTTRRVRQFYRVPAPDRKAGIRRPKKETTTFWTLYKELAA